MIHLLCPNCAGAMMGFSSLAVMANSLLLQFEGRKQAGAALAAAGAGPKQGQRQQWGQAEQPPPSGGGSGEPEGKDAVPLLAK